MKAPCAVEGITLATFAFEERSHIVSILSKEHGRIKCIHKGSRKSQARGLTPLLGVELQVIVTEKELWKCSDCIVVTSYPQIRQQLATLRYAAQMTDFLDKTLPLHHPVEKIYELYRHFLHHLPHFLHPHVAASAFLAKFYALEGLLEPGWDLHKRPFAELYQHHFDLGVFQELYTLPR